MALTPWTDQIGPIADTPRIALTYDEHLRRGIRRAVGRQTRLPIARDQAALCDKVNVIGERQRDDIGADAVDHRARLTAGAAMALRDGDGLAAMIAGPFRCEEGIVLFVQFTRRIVRNIEQSDGRRLRIRNPGAGGESAEAKPRRNAAPCKIVRHK